MKIVVDINHPAHVHYFKNFIWEMQKRGHQILITATEKDVACTLLDRYNLEYRNLGHYGSSLISKVISLPLIDIRMYLAVRKFQPDIFLGFGSIRAAHVAFLLRKPCINFEDTEHSTGQIGLYLPFVSTVCTPSCFNGDLGPKQIRFNGFMELAALHPNQFIPNPAVLAELGLSEGDPFFIVRLISWNASHDIGQHGIRDKIGLIQVLEKYGRVLITSEGTLPPVLQSYQIRVSPEKLHDLLYFATVYLGEGGTTAAEAGVLGTPSIFISSLAGTMGNFIELEKTYGLLYSFSDCDAAIGRAKEILQNPFSKEEWRMKRKKLLKDKIDVTAFIVWFVENYPRSFEEMKEHQKIQYSSASVPVMNR